MLLRERNSLKKAVFNIAIFSIIFMYINILPISGETQPFIIALLLPLSMFFIDINKPITKSEKALSIYMLIIIFYFLITLAINLDIKNSLSYFIRIIFCPLAFMLILKNAKYLSIKTLKLMVVFLAIVFFILITKFPLLYQALISLMSTVFHRYTLPSGVRGFSIFTTEPSYYVYFAILILYGIDFVEYKDDLKDKSLLIYRGIVLFIGIFTKSALVYFFILVYIFQKVIKALRNKKAQKLIIFFIGCIVVFMFFLAINKAPAFLQNNRFYNIISKYDFSNGVFNAIFFQDDSSGFRFLINFIFLLSIFLYPFGAGLGGLSDKWSQVAKFFNIDLSKNGMFVYVYNVNDSLDAQALFPNIISSIGIFAVFLFIFFFFNNKLENKNLKKNIVFILFLFLFFFQSNFTNPVFWVLAGFCKYQKEKEGKYLNAG